MAQIPKTQFTILQGIVAHPNESPSLLELDEMNPSLEREEIQEHLQQLIDANIVEKPNARDTVSNYRLTGSGRDELTGTGLFNAETTLKHYYLNTS
ncbi:MULTISPECIES: hypothetical protein [Natrialbaceae]|uniref:hypothetical protein n=1 Tax=Natrialbaceae TaxID=1644061 RepID=UPI001CEFD7B1|nr:MULTISPECIES: hypothetical protein [Natrialbaceae]